jgi:hypothetical protein
VDKRTGNDEEMSTLIRQLVWLGIWLAISLGISMILPFPISLVVIMGFFILLNMYRRKTIMKRMSVGADIGTGIFSSGNATGGIPLKYYCMSCGTPHREAVCLKCGSKMKRVGS